jgi:large subunit ribosomal protein L21
MFAVLKTGGKQYKVQAGDVLRVEKLAANAGDKIQFNEILMVGGETVTLGVPMVAGAAVVAEVIDQIKGEKTSTTSSVAASTARSAPRATVST